MGAGIFTIAAYLLIAFAVAYSAARFGAGDDAAIFGMLWPFFGFVALLLMPMHVAVWLSDLGRKHRERR